MLDFLLPYRLPIIHLHNMNTRNTLFHLYSLVFLSSTCNLTPTRGLKFCQKILTPLASISCFYTDVISQEREKSLDEHSFRWSKTIAITIRNKNEQLTNRHKKNSANQTDALEASKAQTEQTTIRNHFHTNATRINYWTEKKLKWSIRPNLIQKSQSCKFKGHRNTKLKRKEMADFAMIKWDTTTDHTVGFFPLKHTQSI